LTFAAAEMETAVQAKTAALANVRRREKPKLILL
jgi:hypothetical protein